MFLSVSAPAHRRPLAGALAAAVSFLWSGAGGSEWTARALALVLQFTSVVSSNWILISVFVLINNSCYSHQVRLPYLAAPCHALIAH